MAEFISSDFDRIAKFLRALKAGFTAFLQNSGPSEADFVFCDGLFVRVRDDHIAVVCRGPEMGDTERISLDEAKQLFRSIKRACDLHQIEEIKFARFSWKTNACTRSKWIEKIIADGVILAFFGGSGTFRAVVARDTLNSVVTNFIDRFGLDG
jgi:hypothetical protein